MTDRQDGDMDNTPPLTDDELRTLLHSRLHCTYDGSADNLLPTVRDLLNQAEKRGAVQALRDAGDAWEAARFVLGPVRRWLRARADRIEAS